MVVAAASASAAIVFGSRRRDFLQRLLLGSASGELLFEAPWDVLVVR